MFLKVIVMVGISFFSLFFPGYLFADERSCLAAYSKATIAIENAGIAGKAGNACRAADGIEIALNWIGTCEEECRYSRERMNQIEKTKSSLMKVFPVYVQQCGR